MTKEKKKKKKKKRKKKKEKKKGKCVKSIETEKNICGGIVISEVPLKVKLRVLVSQ